MTSVIPNLPESNIIRNFSGLKFSLEYLNICTSVLSVYFAVSMTAGQPASSLRSFIEYMLADT